MIYDLKIANPNATVSVKLASKTNIGTIGLGVYKAGAETNYLAAGGGGTGASPISSILYAGMPWELAVADVHQQTVNADWRGNRRINADGALRTGYAGDALRSFMMGSDGVDYGMESLVAEGCVRAGVCEKNTCLVGIATQDPFLRALYTGKPEYRYKLLPVPGAGSARASLAAMKAKSVDEIIGRTDLLEQVDFRNGLDLSDLYQTLPPGAAIHYAARCRKRIEVPETLDHRILRQNGFRPE